MASDLGFVPLPRQMLSLSCRGARCVSDDLVSDRPSSADARLLSASAMACYCSSLSCRKAMAARIVEWPMRSISSRRLAPSSCELITGVA
jgi:hypothetical protein